jgi:branched-chain amino acid transport system ATP-binding protein
MTEILHVTDVTVRFGGVYAVQNVDLRINNGELIGFIGPNGAGKTTLMRVITGIVQPQSGRVFLQGVDITDKATHLRIRAGLALAQQIVQPLRALTLLDNVAIACGSDKTRHALKSMWVTDIRSERAQARELLARVGLSHVVD